jgi:tRNA pseudouridine38-40 synthase
VEQLQGWCKRLPPTVQLYNLQAAPLPRIKTINGVERLVSWNVIYEATQKLYSYRLHLGPTMMPLERHSCWHPDQAHLVSVPQLERLCQHYVGTHDFAAFANVERMGNDLNTVRTVNSIKLINQGNDYYRLDILLQGALYKQVRNMIGTAVAVCLNKMDENQFLELLQGSGSVRSDNKCKPAPPQGLTLEHVYFEDY